MMECLEFETGIDASLELTGDLKQDSELDALLHAEAEKNAGAAHVNSRRFRLHGETGMASTTTIRTTSR